MSSTSYDEICAGHRWEVPARYNIASDVCDKHARNKPAMVQDATNRHRERDRYQQCDRK